MLHPNPKMLLRIAQADAFCAATEYIKLPQDQKIFDEAIKLEGFVKHPRHKIGTGIYTDDGQMSIAVAESLLSGEELNEINFANSFVNSFRRDPRRGYAAGFQKFLGTVKNGQELLDKIHGDSEKNGAAMRSVPLGILPTPEDVLNIAKLQASITHNSPAGIFSSQAVALMSHYSLYEDDGFDKLIEYCQVYLPLFETFGEPFNERVQGPNVSIKTVHAVVQLLRTETNLLGLLKGTILLGGDTDSVAAIAWGIASSRMTEDLPDWFETCLEPGQKYGVEYLKKLGEELFK